MRGMLLLLGLVAVGFVVADAVASVAGMPVPVLTRGAMALCGGGEPGEPCYCPRAPPPLDRFVAINC